MRPYRVKPYTVPSWIHRALLSLRPAERLPVSKWAEKWRVLPDTNAIPGPFRNSVTPYLAEIMDAFSNEDVERIVFVKPTQVGGTTALENMLASAIDQDPAPTMIVYPSKELAERTVEAKLITAGIDVQENCLYWTIRAWGDYMTSQNIAHGQALSMNEVAQIMNTEFIHPDGQRLLVSLALMDSGDQTDEVYDFCLLNSDWVLPSKGTGTMLSNYRLSTINKAGSNANGMTLVLVDGGKYKDMIAARMRKPNGKGSWMVYKGCDLEYAEQVTAEHKVTERANGKVVQKWVPKTTHADNHYLDCEVYAAAAADMQGVRSLYLQSQEPEKPKKPKPEPAPTPEENWIQQNESWV